MPNTQNKKTFFELCLAQNDENNQKFGHNRTPLSEWACETIYDALVKDGHSDAEITRAVQKIVFFYREDSLETLIMRFVASDGQGFYSSDGTAFWDSEDLLECDEISFVASKDISYGESERVLYFLNYFTLDDF